MVQQWISQFTALFPNVFVPEALVKTFDTVACVWDAFPTPIRFSLAACFTMACVFAILKMLF